MMTVDRINTAFDALKMAAEAAGLNVQEVENMRVLALAGLSQPEDMAISLLRAWVAGCGDEHFSTKEQCRDLLQRSGDYLASLTSQPKDAERFAWLIEQPASVQDSVLRPPIPPELLGSPEKWPDIIRAAIDARLRRRSPA